MEQQKLFIIVFFILFELINAQSYSTIVASMSNFAGALRTNGNAFSVPLNFPNCIDVDSKNNFIFFTEGNLVRAVNLETSSTIVFAGSTTSGYTGDGNAATSATLFQPNGIAIDEKNNLIFIADSWNHVIRVVQRSSGAIFTLAGNGSIGYSGDGKIALGATFKYPHGLAFDAANNLLYIADSANNVVRVLDCTTYIISTFAGNGSQGYSGDGYAATKATFFFPIGVAVDSLRNLVYITENLNHVVRVVNRTTGIISTIAGQGIPGFSENTGVAKNAIFDSPTYIQVDSEKNLIYISDTNNNAIRVIDGTTGLISMFAGTTAKGYSGDGGIATNATFKEPMGIALDSTKKFIYIADSGLFREAFTAD